jgi:hypothetical protein
MKANTTTHAASAKNTNMVNEKRKMTEEEINDESTIMFPLTLLMLCGIGPNNTRFVYGFAMAKSESSNALDWMLGNFKAWGLILDVPETIILSDRGAAIIKA